MGTPILVAFEKLVPQRGFPVFVERGMVAFDMNAVVLLEEVFSMSFSNEDHEPTVMTSESRLATRVKLCTEDEFYVRPTVEQINAALLTAQGFAPESWGALVPMVDTVSLREARAAAGLGKVDFHDSH